MEDNEINKRYKILKFFDKYGIDATIEAFDVSRRTIYRCKAKHKTKMRIISNRIDRNEKMADWLIDYNTFIPPSFSFNETSCRIPYRY